MPAKRFYWKDGRVTRHGVDEIEPPAWRLFAEAEAAPDWLGIRDFVAPRRVVIFERRDYGYPDGFIGPRRDSEYHEC